MIAACPPGSRTTYVNVPLSASKNGCTSGRTMDVLISGPLREVSVKSKGKLQTAAAASDHAAQQGKAT
jgi:hypothetical protein